jgi:hypothetical protein
LIWAEGDNGGTPVIDWRLYYTLGDDTVEISGISQASYTATESLITDQIYNFKVQARNSVGYSSFSEEI